MDMREQKQDHDIVKESQKYNRLVNRGWKGMNGTLLRQQGEIDRMRHALDEAIRERDALARAIKERGESQSRIDSLEKQNRELQAKLLRVKELHEVETRAKQEREGEYRHIFTCDEALSFGR